MPSRALVHVQVQRWLESAFFGKSMSYSPSGMLWGQDWGTLRIAALYAHIAFKAAEILDKAADDTGEVVNVRAAAAVVFLHEVYVVMGCYSSKGA